MMDSSLVIELVFQALRMALVLSGPILLGLLIVGLLIGIVQSLMSTIWPEGARLMIYVAMGAVLLLRPHGLLGRG